MKLFEIKKQDPTWLIAESFVKNQHLEHLEDLIFNNGYDGAIEALNYIENLRLMLAEGTGTSTKLTVKWDGSPAIVCGIDPADSKFFVGTKSVFNKTQPKLCKSIDDIHGYYSQQPDLMNKIEYSFKYLSKLGISGVIQGDLMFTDTDLSIVSVENEDCYVFTPNTITYAVPVNSQLGQKISKAKIGIIFHTGYEGDSIAKMKATFGLNLSGLTLNSDIWVDDATYKDYTGIASLTPVENKQLLSGIKSAYKTMDKISKSKFDVIIHEKDFTKLIKPFINKQIRKGTQITNPINFLNEFLDYYTQDLLKDIEELHGGIAGNAAKKRLEKIKKREEWIADNSNALLGILAVYKRVIELKHIILNKLGQVESIGTFQKTENGYKVTNPEGFVAIGHTGGAVKLVDRLEFSKNNFLKRA